MYLLIQWLILTASILISAYFLPSVQVSGLWTAIWLAAFLGIVNVLVKPFLLLLTLPINILTFGLFTFVINALLILFAASIIKGFSVGGFFSALLFSIILSLVNYLLQKFFQKYA